MKRVDGDPLGILRGPSGSGGMDVVAPHLAQPPARGDFLLVPDGERALVLRIAGAVATGSFAEYSERGADYLAQLARREADVPARIRDLLLRFRIDVVPLGWLEAEGSFRAGVRSLQLFGHPVYRPSDAALRVLVNAGLRDDDPSRVRIGRYARGHDVAPDVPVDFSIRRLKGRRTFVFARAGYGKSNLVKLLLSRLYATPPDVGLLIVDPEGEYAFPQRSESGKTIPGLVDHPDIRPRLKVFTNRNAQQFPAAVRERIAGPVSLDVAEMSANEFLLAFVPEEKQAQIWANWLRSAPGDGWRRLVELLRQRQYAADDEAILGALGIRGPKKKEGDVSVAAIRNNLVPVLGRLDGPVDLVARARDHLILRAGVVVLDVSAMSGHDADAIVRVLLQHLFQDRVNAFTRGLHDSRGVLLVLEEAQSVLGTDTMDDRDIYVRWVKEGRKYGLGAMLVTQQPGAIAPQLVSQGDNFFAMHLLAERDLRVLGQANAHYTKEILEFLRDEPVKGNCYLWSAPDQPYVVAARVDNYEDGVPASEAPREEVPYETWLRDAVLQALCEERSIFLYRVARLGGQPVAGTLAIAIVYLSRGIPGASALQETRAEDWDSRREQPALRFGAMERALRELGVLAAPACASGRVQGRDSREMWVLREDRLVDAARKAGLVMKAIQPEPVELVEWEPPTPRG